MKVEVTLFGFLRKFSPGESDSFALELSEESSVGDVIKKLGMPHKEPCMIILNGRHSEEDALTTDGDEIVIMTPVEGG
jgi:molybdopterin converting factor small subunit